MSYHPIRRRRMAMGNDQLDQAIYQAICNPSSSAYDPTQAICASTATDMQTGVSTQVSPTGVPIGPGTPSQAVGCVVQANAATAPLDAYVADLSANWQPTGFYTPKQINDGVAQVMSVLTPVLQAAQSALSQTIVVDASGVQQAIDSVNNAIAGAKVFTDGAASGIQQIEAPGFKRWVTNSLDAASNSTNAIYVNACVTPWWAAAFNAIASFFQAAWNFFKKLLGVVADLAKQILKIPDLISTLLSVAPYAAAAVAAYLLYEHVYKKGKK